MDENIPEPHLEEQVEYDIIPLPPEEPRDPSKTGNKPKQLRAMETLGYQVGRGLRRKIVNPDDVFKLAAIGSSDREIARWFDIDEATLRYNFNESLIKGREEVKMSIRQAQLKLALGGNAVMLIWLGKNLLGQSDTPDSADTNKILPWSDDEDTAQDSDD